MKKFYILYVFLLFAFTGYTQEATSSAQNYYVSKAWVNESEEWAFYEYEGQIVVSTTAEPGKIKITNRNFLYDFCSGGAKFANKNSYTTAEFTSPVKIGEKTDKQGVLNTTYEGKLVFNNGEDYYFVFAVVTILSKDDLVGLKMKIKNKTNREYAFTFKPTS